MVAPIYIPTNSVRGFLFLHTRGFFFFFLIHLELWTEIHAHYVVKEYTHFRKEKIYSIKYTLCFQGIVLFLSLNIKFAKYILCSALYYYTED